MGSAGITGNDTVLEIGPGLGVLTREAAGIAARVVAVEIDRHLIPILQETLADLENVQVVRGDALETDLNSLVYGEKHASGGNRPFYHNGQFALLYNHAADIAHSEQPLSF